MSAPLLHSTGGYKGYVRGRSVDFRYKRELLDLVELSYKCDGAQLGVPEQRF